MPPISPNGVLPREASRWCVGIDPGASGGIALLLRRRGLSDFVRVFKMPDSLEGTYELARLEFRGISPAPLVYIEQLTGYIGDGGNPGSGQFKLGRNVGRLEAIVRAITLSSPQEVHPATWQRLLGVEKKRKGESGSSFKGRLKAHAQGLFPGVKVTLWNADALLLAEYAYCVHTGSVVPPTKRRKPSKRRKPRKVAGVV